MQDVKHTIDEDEFANAAFALGTETDKQKAARRAMKMCGGNKAGALATLQRDELGINTSCWLFL